MLVFPEEGDIPRSEDIEILSYKTDLQEIDDPDFFSRSYQGYISEKEFVLFVVQGSLSMVNLALGMKVF